MKRKPPRYLKRTRPPTLVREDRYPFDNGNCDISEIYPETLIFRTQFNRYVHRFGSPKDGDIRIDKKHKKKIKPIFTDDLRIEEDVMPTWISMLRRPQLQWSFRYLRKATKRLDGKMSNRKINSLYNDQI